MICGDRGGSAGGTNLVVEISPPVGDRAFAMVLGIVIIALGPYPGDLAENSLGGKIGDFLFSNGNGPLSISSSSLLITRFGDESESSRVLGLIELTRRSLSFVNICFSNFDC